MFDFYDYIDEKVKDLLEKNPSLSNDEIIDEVLNGITLKDLVLNCGSLTADKAISEISGTILRYRKNNAVVDVTERLLSSYIIKEDYNMVFIIKPFKVVPDAWVDCFRIYYKLISINLINKSILYREEDDYGSMLSNALFEDFNCTKPLEGVKVVDRNKCINFFQEFDKFFDSFLSIVRSNNNDTIYNTEYVDLGLPSGKKWAKCNLGANSEEESGLYFQWGDTVGYTAEQVGTDKTFNWKNYKWSIDGSSINFSKYNSRDGKTVLDLEDDAVYAALGGNWRMPTVDDWRELYNNADQQWVQINGVNGYKLTGKNGNYIFLPAAGLGSGSSLDSEGSSGYIWYSSLDSVISFCALACNFGSYWFDPVNTNSRLCGFPIRGIYVEE